LRIAIVSSRDLIGRPWSPAHHIPADPTDRARALVAAYQYLAAHPSDEVGWQAAMRLVLEQVARRRAYRPAATCAATAPHHVDCALFDQAAIPGSDSTFTGRTP
jgi:hypothetical protein